MIELLDKAAGLSTAEAAAVLARVAAAAPARTKAAAGIDPWQATAIGAGIGGLGMGTLSLLQGKRRRATARDALLGAGFGAGLGGGFSYVWPEISKALAKEPATPTDVKARFGSQWWPKRVLDYATGGVNGPTFSETFSPLREGAAHPWLGAGIAGTGALGGGLTYARDAQRYLRDRLVQPATETIRGLDAMLEGATPEKVGPLNALKQELAAAVPERTSVLWNPLLGAGPAERGAIRTLVTDPERSIPSLTSRAGRTQGVIDEMKKHLQAKAQEIEAARAAPSPLAPTIAGLTKEHGVLAGELGGLQRQLADVRNQIARRPDLRLQLQKTEMAIAEKTRLLEGKLRGMAAVGAAQPGTVAALQSEHDMLARQLRALERIRQRQLAELTKTPKLPGIRPRIAAAQAALAAKADELERMRAMPNPNLANLEQQHGTLAARLGKRTEFQRLLEAKLERANLVAQARSRGASQIQTLSRGKDRLPHAAARYRPGRFGTWMRRGGRLLPLLGLFS